MIRREQHVQAGRGGVAQAIVQPAEAIGVSGLADIGLRHVGNEIEIAAPGRRQPLTATVGEARRRQRIRVEDTQPRLVVAIGLRPDRARVDHRTDAVAKLCGESARIYLHAVERARVENAGRARQHAQMKRLVHRQTVEDDQGLGLFASAHVRETGEPVGRGAWQAVHGFERVVRQPWQRLELGLREKRLFEKRLVREPVAAAGDHDFFDGYRYSRSGRGHGRVGLRRPADDGVNDTAHVLRAQAMRRQQLFEQSGTGCRRRFDRDAQTRRHDLGAVHQPHRGRADIVQYVGQAATAIGRLGGR